MFITDSATVPVMSNARVFSWQSKVRSSMRTILFVAVENYEESQGIWFENKGKTSFNIAEWKAVMFINLR